MMRFLIWLGHGRALEMNYIGIKLLFGLLILYPPKHSIEIVAISDLQWFLPGPVIAAPFVIAGSLQLVGWLMNIYGYESNRWPRMIGSFIGGSTWTYLVIKSIGIGIVATGMFPVAFMGVLASVFLWWKAWNRLPIPGIPGPV